MLNSISAIIPAYNEAEQILSTIRQVQLYVDEVIVVDDGSTDDTAAIAEAAGVIVLRQGSNQGYIPAIKRGFAEASGDVVLTIDADGEFPSERIPDLVKPILRGEADMVQGRRDIVPRLSERFLTWLAGLRAPVGDSGSGFRALRSDFAQQLTFQGACICGVFSLDVLSRGGRISEIPVQLIQVAKPRKLAWYHLRQFFYLVPWLVRRYPHPQ